MSRLIVKGLPSNCTEASLRKFFKKYAPLTDCTLKYTKEGVFRKFAFVGFDDGAKAQDALRETNGTFMGSARIRVEECLPFGDANKPRAWSQHSKDSSAYKRKNAAQEEKGSSNISGDSEEPVSKKTKKEKSDFNKFLEARGIAADQAEVSSSCPGNENETQLLDELLEGISGDLKLSLIFTGLPASLKQKSFKEWLSPIRIKAMKIARNEESAAALVTFNRPPDVRRALKLDQQFLGGFKVSVRVAENTTEDERENDQEDVYNREEDETPVDRATEEEQIRDKILDTGRLFLRNLPFTTKEEDIRYEFKKYGEIAEIQVIINKNTGACKGFAIVDYVFPESAVAAYTAMDGKIFKGRMIHILPGEDRKEKKGDREDGNEEGAGDGSTKDKASFKKEKLAKLKANAGKSHSWNALFLGANAVAETLAEKLSVEKSDLLLGENGESAGVRLALAETKLVREIRDFLVANGVKLDSFSRPAAKRSDTVILVKNLPGGVTEEELTRMFERFGDLRKVLVPPEGGVTALIVFGNPVDSKKAFKALAYSRFRTQPLYLEWAPCDVFGEDNLKRKSKVTTNTKEEVEDNEEIEEKPKKSKKEMTYEEKMELKRKKKEAKAIKEESSDNNVDQVMFDVEASTAEPEPSSVEATESTEVEKDADEDEGLKSGCTVFVKNLAFASNEESLKSLFKKHFRVRNATISRKLNPADPSKSLSMGFGFVEFFSPEDAKQAVRDLQGELLDGHAIELKLSHREVMDSDGLKRKSASSKEQGQCTKIIVRNLPFQAKVKEVENLFATFGEIRSIRIPRKVGSKDQHRGFGFVDFLSVGEAKRAFEALVHSTHLYGRRLVLEWANEEETVQELREKTAEKFSGDKKENKKRRDRLKAIEKDLSRTEPDSE